MNPHRVVAVARAAAIDSHIEEMAAVLATPYVFELCAPDTASAALDHADTIVLPARLARAPLTDQLRAAHLRGARLCAIGPGLFALAATGLLDGRRVAAPPALADRLLRRHPDLHIKSGALFIDAGQILSASSHEDGLAMLLHLVRRDHGPAAAELAARRLAARQATRDIPATEDERFGRLLAWLRDHPAQPHTLASMALQAGIDDASLQRRFMEKTGMAALDWLRQARLALLGSLLATDAPPADKPPD